MLISDDLQQAIAYLTQGEIIAYPTEGVFGLGCDAFNEDCVLRLIDLKKRSLFKGFIILVSNWQQVERLTKPLSASQLEKIQQTWPGPVTWTFPASHHAPSWLQGNHHTLAIRMTNHPLARRLCESFQQPIVSTSANPTELPAAKTIEAVVAYFDQQIPFILRGLLGNLQGPTPIYDALSGKIIRSTHDQLGAETEFLDDA